MNESTSAHSCPLDGAPLFPRELPLGEALTCALCGGAWLEWLLVEREVSARVATAARSASAGASLVERRCPARCGQLAQWDLLGIAVDTCQSCGGLWLDKGEARRIVEAARLRRGSNPEWELHDMEEQVAVALVVVDVLGRCALALAMV